MEPVVSSLNAPAPSSLITQSLSLRHVVLTPSQVLRHTCSLSQCHMDCDIVRFFVWANFSFQAAMAVIVLIYQ